mgnify:CR=1 FL=1
MSMNNLTIIERFRENEELARKFHEVETSILSIFHFADLFEVLLTQISESFKIPFVWISLIEQTELSGLMREVGRSQALREQLNRVDRETLLGLTEGRNTPLLVNGDLRAYFRLFPAERRFIIRSLAMVPLFLDGELIGTLNCADASPERYRPGLNPVFLERLAVKVSLCLSNVTAHERLRVQAHHDSLTNLYNRRALEEGLKRELGRVRRYAGLLSLVFLDLDEFKGVNDTFGHDAGDRVLVHLARVLQAMTREADLVARLAGDEFVLVLPETPPESARRLLQRIQQRLCAEPCSEGQQQIVIGLSYGIASTLDGDFEEVAPLLKLADERLYQFKRERKTKA